MKKFLGIIILVLTTSAVYYALNDYLNYRVIEFSPRRALGALFIGIVITVVLVKMVFKPKAGN